MTGTPTRSPSADAELRKLAHSLGVDVARLSMLDGMPGEDVRALRHQIGDALFRADKHYFARLAALSRSVPTAVAAKLTETVLPPLIAARTAELLEPRKAADLVARISPAYLADVSAAMDASRSPEVIAAIPPDRVASVGAELARRGEWVVIGGFVSQVTDEALARTVAGFDGEQLLRIGYVLDDVGRLDRISELLTDAQVDELLAAAPAHGLWPEVADLLRHLGDAHRARLRERYAGLPDAVRAGYAAAVSAGGLDAGTLALLTG